MPSSQSPPDLAPGSHRPPSRSTVQRRAQRGQLTRLARGVYAHTDAQWSLHRDLLKVALHSPRAPFCLLTALHLHGLRSQAPDIWVALGNKARVPFVEGVPIQVGRYSAESLVRGVEEMELDGTVVRVTGIARTLVDCFKYRSSVGLDVAVSALRLARGRCLVSLDQIDSLAWNDRMSGVMRPYLLATA